MSGDPSAAEDRPEEAGNWLTHRSRTWRDGWGSGSVEGLARGVEVCAELGPRNHAAACKLIEDGMRRFGERFLDELKKRGVDPERFV